MTSSFLNFLCVLVPSILMQWFPRLPSCCMASFRYYLAFFVHFILLQRSRSFGLAAWLTSFLGPVVPCTLLQRSPLSFHPAAVLASIFVLLRSFHFAAKIPSFLLFCCMAYLVPGPRRSLHLVAKIPSLHFVARHRLSCGHFLRLLRLWDRELVDSISSLRRFSSM